MHAKKLRDAVHGDIHLTPLEVAALDTPEMQRLRGIRQLGAAYYVYPSAQHTRFEHGLGSCHMARRIMRQIKEEGGYRFDETAEHAVALAALVHDVTHIPFGHTFEDERRLLERHDRSAGRYRRLLQEGALGELLSSNEAGRTALRILSAGRKMPAGQQHLRDIVSGTICADLLDYLKRDNYFCGLCYEFDERLFHYFRVAGGRMALDMAHGGLLRPDALTEITNLLRIRYVLSERVYYHHAKIAAGVMISKAVEHALAAGLTEADLCTLTDGTLLYRMRDRFGDDAALVELLDDFEARRLFKRCYMISRDIGEKAVQEAVRRYHLNRDGERDRAEQRIAKEIGAPPHRVAVYCAPAGMALKEADVPALTPSGLTLLSEVNSVEIKLLQQQHRALWKLYVLVSPRVAERDAARLAGRACSEIIGFPNELPC